MKILLSIVLLLAAVNNYYFANATYSSKCAWWISNLSGNDTNDCTINSPCQTLTRGFDALVNAPDTDCTNDIARLLHLIPGKNYESIGSVGIRLSYSWIDDHVYNYPIIVQSADMPANPDNFQYPLPLASNNVVFDGKGKNYHIHFGNIAPLTIFRGFTFINGKDTSKAQNEGAPIVVSPTSTVNFDSCTFSNNYGYQTGVIFINAQHACNITNSIFTNNWGDPTSQVVTSGALFIQSQVVIASTTFTNNSGTNGGAVRIKGANVRIISSTFRNNNGVYGGAISLRDQPLYTDSYWYDNQFINNNASYGGAIYDRDSSVDSRSSVFDGNVATEFGGAVAFNGSISTFALSTFKNNRAKNGGAIWSYDPRPMERQSLISDSLFTNNSASLAGGALYCTNSTARFNVNNNFTLNKATTDDTDVEYCTETCLTASRECGCTKGCGLPPPPVKIVTDKTETKITVAVFLPVTAILLGIVAFLLWKTNKKAKFVRSNEQRDDEIRLTPTNQHPDDELQEQL